MDKEKKTMIEAVARELLDQIGLQAEVVLEEKQDSIWVQLKPENPGALIGYHGETLESFQHLLKMIINQKTGEWPAVVVDVSDYRQNREKTVHNMCQAAVQRVRLSGQPHQLSPLPAFERKIAHMFVSQEKDLVSESIGEGRDRRVVIKLQAVASSSSEISQEQPIQTDDQSQS